MKKLDWWKDRVDESQVLKHLNNKPQTPGDLIRAAGLSERMNDAGAFLTTLHDLVVDGRVKSIQRDCGAGCFVPAFFVEAQEVAA